MKNSIFFSICLTAAASWLSACASSPTPPPSTSAEANASIHTEQTASVIPDRQPDPSSAVILESSAENSEAATPPSPAPETVNPPSPEDKTEVSAKDSSKDEVSSTPPHSSQAVSVPSQATKSDADALSPQPALSQTALAADSTSFSPDNASRSADSMTYAQKLNLSASLSAKRFALLNDLISGKTSDASAFWKTVDDDVLLTEILDEEVSPHGTNTLSALGGGSTVSFKYKDSADASAKAAIKPDQDLRQTMYRSEIAYYRLCQILGCSFDTPVTRPARWTKSKFNALYDTSTAKNRGYRTKFEHLIWAKEADGQILYAAYKEWIPSFSGFPIENTAAWTTYERVGTTAYPDMKTLLKKVLTYDDDDDDDQGEGDHRHEHQGPMKNLSKFVSYTEGMSSRDLLQQLSDLTLIDFLTNNWDRYSGARSNYGANCNIQPGGIIAIDNGAALPPWHAPRVVRRLHLVQTFSRRLVGALRILDPDALMLRLLPNPTKEEKRSIERFKERRIEGLKYIDDLIKKHGEDKVLVF